MMRTVRASLRFVRGLLISFALLFIVVTFTPVVRMIALAIDQDWYDRNGEVLVVLGGGMLVGGTGPNAAPDTSTYLRCVYASWVLQQQRFTYVVVTGDGGTAEAMAHYLRQNGVGSATVLIENRAHSTFENALLTKQLLEQRYGRRKLPAAVVLTSDYHSWRARRVFEHAGFDTHTIPVPDVIKQSSSLPGRWPAFVTLATEFGKDSFYFAQGRL